MSTREGLVAVNEVMARLARGDVPVSTVRVSAVNDDEFLQRRHWRQNGPGIHISTILTSFSSRPTTVGMQG